MHWNLLVGFLDCNCKFFKINCKIFYFFNKIVSVLSARFFNILIFFKDYFDIVKKPMDLQTIGTKLDTGLYNNPREFCDDMWLMFENAWTYNRKNSKVYKFSTKVCMERAFSLCFIMIFYKLDIHSLAEFFIFYFLLNYKLKKA